MPVEVLVATIVLGLRYKTLRTRKEQKMYINIACWVKKVNNVFHIKEGNLN